MKSAVKKRKCLLVGNIYESKGQNGNVYLPASVSPTILSGETNNKNNGGIGSNNAPKILMEVLENEVGK